MKKWASGAVCEGRNNDTTTIYNDSHCFVTYSLPWRMHRYSILGIEILNRVESSLSFGMLLAFCPITNNRATLLHVASQVRKGPPFQKFRKTIVQLNPFPLSRHTRKWVSQFRLLFAFVWLIHARRLFYRLNRVLSREKAINTRNLYIEHFCILHQWFDTKKCQRWKNS